MTEGIVARRIAVDGTVQGVGFRPFVWRLANRLCLAGTVRNIDGRVEIEVSGPAARLAELTERIRAEAPPRARVHRVTVTELPLPTVPPVGFAVTESATGGTATADPAVHAPAARTDATADGTAVDSGMAVDPAAEGHRDGLGSPGDAGATIAGEAPDRLFPPDLATCDACVAELFDPADRRYRYPFINCTDCGPRATIIDALPYDRHRTTMVDFPLCPDCRAEYLDPANRRFHAEPVACPACGPTLSWRLGAGAPNGDGSGTNGDGHGHGDGATTCSGARAVLGEAALAAAVAVLADGGIVAVKGLGGYHLACVATDEAAVRRLRERKHRWAKPLAVMVPDLTTARQYAALSDVATAELTGPARPIVLARYTPAEAVTPLACAVLAGLPTVGLFLPYTGLHHLLLAALATPIVLTSGNLSDEPIAVDDAEAIGRLRHIADGFLAHNRRIRSRYEDSVVTVARGGPVLLRRGRGYAPEPIDLPVPAPEPVLAVGAQLKHTFAIARGRRAHLGSHTGDLADLATLEAYRNNLSHLRELLAVSPRWVAHDSHPGYLSTQEAIDQFPAERRISVQHHHAHVAACLAEHGLAGPVVGVALDGLGMGDDATFWGGEILVADLVGYRRVGRFGRAPMPGGEAAIHQPWRMALGYLFGAEPLDAGLCGARPLDADLEGATRPSSQSPARPSAEPPARRPAGPEAFDEAPPHAVRAYLDRFDPKAVAVLRRQIERRLNAPVASSAGRLFDAASSLLGLRDVVRYEGEAAIVLQHAADPAEPGELPYRLVERDGMTVYDPRPTLAALLSGMAAGDPVPRLAARFQRTVAAAVTALASRAARAAGLDVVCLSGGVFGNEWLLDEVPRRLADAGLTALYPQRTPPGDGGISLGQAAVAAARLATSDTTHQTGPIADPTRVTSRLAASGAPHESGGTSCA